MVSTSVDEETGEEKKRLINRMRWKGYGPASIMFADAIVCSLKLIHKTAHLISILQVPNGPPQVVEEGRNQIDQNILKKLEAASVFPSIPQLSTYINYHIALRRTPRLDADVSLQSTAPQ